MTVARAALAPTATDQPTLGFDQPLPRAIVHKSGPGEVFVTDSASIGDERFVIACELPRSHAFYGDTTGRTPAVDAMTMIELGRQAGYVVLHEHLGVGLDNSFVIRDIHAEMSSAARALEAEGSVRVLCHLELTEATRRRGRLAGFRMAFELVTLAGVPLASGNAAVSWATQERFERFRASWRRSLELPRTPGPVAWADGPLPSLAPGRRSGANAVLAELEDDGTTCSAFLRPNLEHVAMFDHEYDHIPGVVQVEGSRQLAVWGAARRLGVSHDQVWVEGLDVQFRAINELDLHTRCSATFAAAPDGTGLVASVTVTQDGRDLGEVRARLRRH